MQRGWRPTCSCNNHDDPARIVAHKGNLERARELLKPLLDHEEYHYHYHYSEWRAILLAQHQIVLTEQNMKAVFEWDEALEMVKEEFG